MSAQRKRRTARPTPAPAEPVGELVVEDSGAGAVPIPLDRLCLSPLNVRKCAEDAEATGALERTIAAFGLLQPLIAHPVPAGHQWAEPDDATHAVLAGGRRLRALRALAARGELPADTPVPVVVRDLAEGELIELSLAENLTRVDLRPWEVDAAVREMDEAGQTVAEIAAHLGQREIWVRQRLRLAVLDPGIFAEYAGGRLPADLAHAYAATEDQELQRAAWTHFQALPAHRHAATEIRRFLKVADAEEAELLAFVGEGVYRAAGGRFELDLFADEAGARGRIADPGTLRELANNKLAQLRQRLRRRTGRSDLVFLPEPPRTAYTIDHALHVDLGPDAADPGGRDPIDAPDGVACVLAVIEDGGCEASWYWPDHKTKRAAAKQSPAHPEEARSAVSKGLDVPEDAGFDRYASQGQAARAAVKDEHGFSADGLQLVRSLRRELLRATLVADAAEMGSLGRDYATWALLRQELGNAHGAAAAGARGLVNGWNAGDDEPRELAAGFLADTEARRIWGEAVDGIARAEFVTLADSDKALAAWLDAPESVRRLAGAVLAGLMLVRSANVAGWRVPAHDELARRAEADDATLRALWQPTAEFVGLLPKMKRLELAEPVVGREMTTRWSKLKDAELSGAVATVLAGQPDWLHPLLTFGVRAPAQAEAAE